MADDRPIVSTGAKDFGAVDNNRGVVVGDASGYTRVIGKSKPSAMLRLILSFG